MKLKHFYGSPDLHGRLFILRLNRIGSEIEFCETCLFENGLCTLFKLEEVMMMIQKASN